MSKWIGRGTKIFKKDDPLSWIPSNIHVDNFNLM